MSKRILSLALVVMMLVAFVPSTVFTAGAEGEAYRFKLDFKMAYNVSELGLAYTTTENANYINPASVKDYAMTKGMWKYYASGSLSTGYNGIAKNMGLCPQLTYGGKAWLAIKFKVPATGTYDIALNLMEGRDIGSYYIIPGNTATANCLTVATGGTADSIVLVEDSKADTVVEGVALNEGEYILVQRGASAQTSWTCPGIESATFTASGATEFTPLYYGTIYPTTAEKGSTADITANIYDAFTGAAYEGDVAYSFSEDIATVEGSTVTGTKFGEADISAAIDGALTVITPGKLVVPSDETPYRFKYDFGKFYSVEDLGLTLVNQTSDKAYFQAQSITDYAMTNGAWKYYSSKGISTAYNGMQQGTGIRCYSTGGIGSYLAFTLNVPVSGTFNIKLSTPGTSAQVDCFLIPADKVGSSLPTAMNSSDAIALATDFATSAASSTTVKGVEITKGEYVFAWRADLSGWTVPYIKSLEFTTTASSGDYQPVYFGSIDPLAETTFVKGDTFTANARIYDAWDFTQYEGEYTFGSVVPGAFTASGNTITAAEMGVHGLTASIAGAALGVAPKTVTVLNDATPYKFQYNFSKVYEREDLGLKFVYATAASDSAMINPASIVDYAMTHGAWKYHSDVGLSPNYGGLNASAFYPYLTTTSGYIALELNVPVSGTFDINYTTPVVTQASKLYLLKPGTTFASKADIIAAVEAGNGIVIDDNYLYSGGGGYNKDIPGVSIEAGKYILALVANQESGWCRFSLGTLTFATTAPKGDYQPVYFGTVDPMTVEVEASATAAAKIYSATAIDTAYTGDVIFATGDATIASVSGSTVTGVKKGATTLSANISGALASIIPSTVTVKSNVKAYRFVHTFYKVYQVPEAGLTPGHMTSDKSNYDVKTITEYAMTHGAWKFYAASDGVLSSYGGIANGSSYAPYLTRANDYVALKINVPVSGTFDIKLAFPAAGTAKANYYLLPGDTAVADLATVAASDKAIVLGIDIESSGSKTVTVEAAELTAGEYIFYYTSAASGWRQMRPHTLTFTTTGETEGFQPLFYGSVTSAELEVGDQATVHFLAYNAQNAEAFTPSSVTLQVTDTDIASIEGTTVTAHKKGKTTVTATTTGGTIGTVPGEINVVEYGHRFKYGFTSSDITQIPEIDVLPWRNGVEYTYDIRTVKDYAATKGMWKLVAQDGVTTYGGMTGNLTQITPITSPNDASKNFFAIKINVPVAGTYDIDYTARESSSTYIYLLPGDTPASSIGSTIAGEDKVTLFDGVSATKEDGGKTFTTEGVEFAAGEHIIVFKSGYYGNMRPVSLVFTTSGAEIFEPAYVGTIDNVTVGENDVATVNARIYDSYTHEAYTGDVTFAVADAGVASVAGTTITPAALGKSTITANLANSNIIPGNLTVANQELADAFAGKEVTAFTKGTVSVQAYIKGVGDTAEIAPTSQLHGASGKYLLDAPEVEGYEFLYWVKGASVPKRILSFEADYTYTAVGGSNIVIAVYEKADATEANKAEFYNPNGQLITTLEADGKVPAYPVIPGKTATHWQNVNDDKIYEGDDFTLAGDETEIWVAQYVNVETKITVTAVNTTEGTKTVDYGTLVTLTASGDGEFNWWEKTNAEGETEVVGMGETYSFYAWENCTVTAVYKTAAPVYTGSAMKIVVDTFGNNSVMAEFIGFDGAKVVEKGIKIGTNYISMATDAMQFTVVNTTGYDATGYAVIEINGKFFKIEDGE